jgi:hypothetical protein
MNVLSRPRHHADSKKGVKKYQAPTINCDEHMFPCAHHDGNVTKIITYLKHGLKIPGNILVYRSTTVDIFFGVEFRGNGNANF